MAPTIKHTASTTRLIFPLKKQVPNGYGLPEFWLFLVGLIVVFWASWMCATLVRTLR